MRCFLSPLGLKNRCVPFDGPNVNVLCLLRRFLASLSKTTKGAEAWVQAVVQRLGLQSTIWPRGQPRYHQADASDSD